MNEIGITEVRKILEKVVNDYRYYDLVKMSDEDLLKVDLRYDFQLDSLDFEDMFEEIHQTYGIAVEAYNPLAECAFNNEETVENFINMVNDCIE